MVPQVIKIFQSAHSFQSGLNLLLSVCKDVGDSIDLGNATLEKANQKQDGQEHCCGYQDFT